MSDFEFNKVFAAILIAGIVAYLSAFVANKVVHPEKLKEDAVFVEGAPVVASLTKVEKKAEPILHLIATADIAKGEKLSKACAACHSFNSGGPHRVGPNMWEVFNAPKGGKDGYAYSDVMANFGGQWGYVELNQFMWKPKTYMPGTKMNYLGLKKPDDRAAIVAWLRSLSDNPAPLPTEQQIADEIALLAPPEPEPEIVEGESAEGDESETPVEANDSEGAVSDTDGEKKDI